MTEAPTSLKGGRDSENRQPARWSPMDQWPWATPVGMLG